MNVDDFDFDLPREFIADRPARPRDSAKLLVVSDTLKDARVSDLPSELRAGDLLVCNDTRVIAARLTGSRERGEISAKIEATLNRPLGDGRWSAFLRPAKKVNAGERIDFGAELTATLAAKGEGGEVTLDFAASDAAVFAAVDRIGAMPIPPYMGRDADAADRDDYQTVFAERPGAVAAPTAGLHFTPRLLAALSEAGVARQCVTLHVGAGTFLPVTATDTADHVMHPERGHLSPAVADAINATKRSGGRIVAVGTTSLRTIETAAAEDGTIHPWSGDTSVFFTPGHRFRTADLLLTNFHLPRSTLFMLVCAFAGTARMHAAYEHAKSAGYRFYSYGDASLLHRVDA